MWGSKGWWKSVEGGRDTKLPISSEEPTGGIFSNKQQIYICPEHVQKFKKDKKDKHVSFSDTRDVEEFSPKGFSPLNPNAAIFKPGVPYKQNSNLS